MTKISYLQYLRENNTDDIENADHPTGARIRSAVSQVVKKNPGGSTAEHSTALMDHLGEDDYRDHHKYITKAYNAEMFKDRPPEAGRSKAEALYKRRSSASTDEIFMQGVGKKSAADYKKTKTSAADYKSPGYQHNPLQPPMKDGVLDMTPWGGEPMVKWRNQMVPAETHHHYDAALDAVRAHPLSWKDQHNHMATSLGDDYDEESASKALKVAKEAWFDE